MVLFEENYIWAFHRVGNYGQCFCLHMLLPEQAEAWATRIDKIMHREA